MNVTASVTNVAIGQDGLGNKVLNVTLTLESGPAFMMQLALDQIQNWLPGATKTVTIA